MKNIAILYGGFSSEKNVSYDTANSIINSLNKKKYKIIKIEVKEDKKWLKKLVKSKIDLAIIALHGGIGENGSVQGLLECLKIPYLGSKVLGSSIGMNKYVTKELLKSSNINVPKSYFISKNDTLNLDEINLEYPLIIKPNEDGSSYNISIVNNKEELLDKFLLLKNENIDILIEEYIEGDELTVGVVEYDDEITPLDILEIIPQNKFYDYEAKYESEDTVIKKAELDETLDKEIKEMAKNIFSILNAHSYARIDMILKDNIPYILEINTLPGMTEHSLIPKSLNITLSEFFDKQIEDTLK